MQISGNDSSLCVAAAASMTMAVQIQKELAAVDVPCEIISLSPGETRKGCSYGVSYSCTWDNFVRTTLRRAHLSPSQYFRRTARLP